ncbi:MAG: hypothetical protein J6Q20_04730 [Alistipes sp.]|nr:hypothetical protein [Alistipes sp.]
MMISTILPIGLSIIAVATITLGVASFVQRVRIKRLAKLEELLRQRYMRIITAVMLSKESLPLRFPMIKYRGAREVLARVLSAVASSVYGPDSAILGRIASDNGVDEWLLHRIGRSRGMVRAYYMSQLAALPLASAVVVRVREYADDKNRFVRFYALLVRIANDTSSALRHLSEFGEPLSDFEIAEIMALLRRGMLPVACEPLLMSGSRNLQLVGIYIAREFGVEEAKPLLVEIATTQTDEDVARAAIYALVALHSSFNTRNLMASVRSMSADDRQRLCRRLVLEGYSAAALERLFGAREGVYAERLVSTYKRRIVCIPQL